MRNAKHIHTFGTPASAYVHGLAKDGAKTHWPVGLVEVREGNRVFMKSTDTFIGIQDNSILTDETREQLAAFDAASDHIITETDLEKANMSNSAPTTSVGAAFEKAIGASDNAVEMPGVTVTKKDASSSAVSDIARDAAAAVIEGADKVVKDTAEAGKSIIEDVSPKVKKVQEAMQETLASVGIKAAFNSKEKTMSKSDPKSLSLFGVIVRILATIALVVAMICMFVWGGQLAIGYIAGLGLSEAMTAGITLAIAGAAGIASSATAYFGLDHIFDVFSRRERSMSAAAAVAA